MELNLEELVDKNIVVIDGSSDLCRENLCFDENVIKEKWYRYNGAVLYKKCLANGIQLITPDIYFRMPVKPKRAICFRESTVGKNYTREFAKLGIKNAVLSGPEIPLHSCIFFWTLGWQTSHFDHSFMFKGAKDWVSPKSKYHLFLGHHMYPLDTTVESRFAEKKFLTLINSNHRINRYKRWFVNVMQVIRPMKTLVNYEMYLERLKAISYFSRDPDFDLYGTWWDRPVKYTRGEYDAAIKKCYRGHVDDKYETLQKYKFSLCIENCIWMGLSAKK